MKMISMMGTSALVGLVAMAASLDAAAQSQTSRSFATNPAGICQGALPTFETAIRKRPLALQNEGTANAFVTCAFTSQGNITELEMYFRSTNDTASAVTCTAVSSYDTGINVYSTQTVDLTADGEQAAIVWFPANFNSTTTFGTSLVSVSCSLPVGAAINDSYVYFVEVTNAPSVP